ncbi:DUF1793-domain-containing protein [Marasmius fiardii PR-910]|nr:DUF1793-domain-containing protein [Marasmius fiardii PR-910]
MHTLLFALLTLPSLVKGQSFRPAAAPIITRSPYLNAWIDLSSAQSSIPNNYPQFWSGDHLLGLSGLLRVDDGDTYEWMGGAMENADLNFTAKSRQGARLNNLIITATQTILVLSAGPIQFNITYLSPIEPSDIALQSFPFSYVFFDAVSTDSKPHHVQVYSDITGEWLSFSQTVKVQWDTTTSPILTHTAQLSTQNELQETADMSNDGVLYFATSPGNGITWQTGGHYSLRGWFLSQGYLNNTKDTGFRNINDNYPVFAYAHDLGSITTRASIVWAIGLVRDHVIQDTTGSNTISLPGYWTTKFQSDVGNGIQAFLSDASPARERADALDQKILNDAGKVSPNYGTLVSLAARQTFASVESAVGPTNSVYMFMKDIGSSQRVNPVETIYAALPAFLYINSTWGQYLLEPLLQYQTSSQYSASYAAPDIGMTYLTRELNSIYFTLPLDTSSMLIMAWAQARFSGEQTLLNQYYSTFQKWADYIISSNLLYTSGGSAQTSDGLDSNNMTNLAIKGIIGVRAMAEISHTLGRSDDASKYQNQASSWASTWQQLAVSNNHLVSTYSESDSWALMYNLYPDVLLGMKLISQEVRLKSSSFHSLLKLTSIDIQCTRSILCYKGIIR